MKLNKLLLSISIVSSIGIIITSCNDDNDVISQASKEAYILGSGKNDCFRVTGKSGTEWKSRMSNDTIYIQVSPNVDVNEELDGVVPKFFISMGATVTPDPMTPQNFAVEGGIKYTVTSMDGSTSKTYVVTHDLTDTTESGNGYTSSQKICEKTFDKMGYPGEQANFSFSDSRLYGDLNGYIAFCGHEHLVLLARQYSDPRFDSGTVPADPSLALKVFTRDDLAEVGNLNIGSINLSAIRAISSDINGVMVAAVNNANSVDLYYWDSFSDVPKSLGHISENACCNTDGSNYLQITGDLFSEANIAMNAARGPEGNHYMLHVENGVITNVQVISTGVSSGDSNGFQMISPIRTDVNSSYLVGDGEGSGNNTLRVFANTYSGKTKVTMPNVLHNNWEVWWVGTGSILSRTGARRPYVTSMLINGKHYSGLMLGTAWWWHNDIADTTDLNTRVNGTSLAYVVNCAWSFGGTCDWYWDDVKKEAYWAVYTDRYGAIVSRLTCYE